MLTHPRDPYLQREIMRFAISFLHSIQNFRLVRSKTLSEKLRTRILLGQGSTSCMCSLFRDTEVALSKKLASLPMHLSKLQCNLLPSVYGVNRVERTKQRKYDHFYMVGLKLREQFQKRVKLLLRLWAYLRIIARQMIQQERRKLLNLKQRSKRMSNISETQRKVLELIAICLAYPSWLPMERKPQLYILFPRSFVLKHGESARVT
mmetsp:Transcript_12519/g.18376  ORF Transcript_12519/g.18376 Transcript_12519/m.18376 type:complete len:206 (+) Transcript_12519:1335-1952(+)